MIKPYRYTVSGSGSRPFRCEGTIHCEFHDAFDLAMTETFRALTVGEAIYGHPGEGGCTGPYSIDRLVIEQVKQ